MNLVVGLSHPVEFALPTGVAAKAEKTKSTVNNWAGCVLLTLTGADKGSRRPACGSYPKRASSRAHKGKGIKYLEETLRRKVGKTGAS